MELSVFCEYGEFTSPNTLNEIKHVRIMHMKLITLGECAEGNYGPLEYNNYTFTVCLYQASYVPASSAAVWLCLRIR